MTTEDRLDPRGLATQVDTLLADLEQSVPPAVAERVEDLLRAVVGLYGEGLERVLALLVESGQDRVGLLRSLAGDDLVGSLLVLHDLHPDDTTARVQAALDRVRPYLGSHAGGVTLTGVGEDGVVRLQLEGSCDGCPSSAMTVRNAIEDAILAAAPDVVRVEVEGVVSDSGTPLLQIQPFRGPREGGDPSWVHLDVDVRAGAVSLALAAGEPLLVAALPHESSDPDEPPIVVAYRNTCASCDGGLDEASLDATILTCAGCGAAYDLHHAGRPVSATGSSLWPVPLLPEDSGWRVSVAGPVPA